MKRMLKISIKYAVLALMGGVFYREFTKLNDFTGITSLSKVHVHLMVLGVFMFMILALFAKSTSLLEDKNFNKFLYVYNIGMAIAVIMMIVRGITQVLATPLSYGMSMAISGVAGVGHILLGIGLIWVILILIRVSEDDKNESSSII
ncbi:MAG: DUF2871 domain-containing protein [Coprobacillus sp.]